MAPWYDDGEKEIMMARRRSLTAQRRSPYARMRSTHSCPACQGSLTTLYLKSNPANWFVACDGCQYKWDPNGGNPEVGDPLSPGGEPGPPPAPDVQGFQAVRPEVQPEAAVEVQPEPEPEPEDPDRPNCKMCRNPIADSRFQGGEAKKYYCMTCHGRGFSVTVSADEVDFRLKRNKQILYQGPYEGWNPDPNNGIQIGAELQNVRMPIDQQAARAGGEDLDQGEEVVAEGMVAEEEVYQEGADLILGDIHLMSNEMRATIGLSPEGENLLLGRIQEGIISGKRGLGESVNRYSENQFFVSQMVAGGIPDADPVNSPVVLDSMAGDPELAAEEAMANPLYPYTEIGSKDLAPNVSQANTFKVLAETDKNMIICFPTGSGKTACAEAAIASGLLGAQGVEGIAPLTIYVCPSRALTSQVARDLSDPEHPFAQNGWKVALERGQREGQAPDAAEEEVEGDGRPRYRKGIPSDLMGVPWAENLAENVDESSVMVIVPERLLTCLMAKDRYPWVSRITTMIFDEGHLIGESGRGPKFEGQQIYLYRNYYRQIRATEIGAKARIVFMSATMENALELSSWQNHMTGENVDWTVAWGEYQPVPLEISYETVSTTEQEEEEKLASHILETILSEENKGDYRNPRTGRMSRVQMPSLAFVHVLRHGRMIQNIARREYRQCPRCDVIFPAERLPEDVNRFRKADDTICQSCRHFPVEEWEVGFYHAHVAASDQEKMVKDFNSGKSRTLIASPALAAGVNLQAMRELQWEMTRAGKDIPTSVVRQMIGRTGRQSFARDYPDQPGKITIFVGPDKALHHQRRLNAGAYLESHFANPLGVTDNILRSVMMGGVKNWNECGEFMASSLAYYQTQVDRQDPLNIRRALEAISKSAMDGGGENDRIAWNREGEEPEVACLHPDVGLDGEGLGEMVDVWPVVCKACGARGTIAPSVMPRLNWISPVEEIPEEQEIPEGLDGPPEEAMLPAQKDGPADFWEQCPHERYTLGQQPLPTSAEVWPITCDECRLKGTIDYRAVPKDDGHYGKLSEDGVRDLVASGLMMMDPQGNLTVTKLGADIVIAHMDCSSAIDIMRNAGRYDVATANPLQLSYILGKLRINDDEDSGRYITEEQASFCKEACSIMGMTPKAATPAVKMVQCIYWALRGIPFDEIPDCLKKDYLAVGDEYADNFTRGFEAISSRARWFENDRKRLETIEVQLKKQVSPEAAKFAVVEGIKREEASALSRAGFTDLLDVMRAPTDDIRWGDYYYYNHRQDKAENPQPLPSTLGRDLFSPAITEKQRRAYRWEARYIKDVAKVGLDGKKGGKWVKKKRETRTGNTFWKLEYTGGFVDPAYHSSVWTLNEQEAALAVEGGEPAGGEAVEQQAP